MLAVLIIGLVGFFAAAVAYLVKEPDVGLDKAEFVNRDIPGAWSRGFHLMSQKTAILLGVMAASVVAVVASLTYTPHVSGTVVQHSSLGVSGDDKVTAVMLEGGNSSDGIVYSFINDGDDAKSVGTNDSVDLACQNSAQRALYALGNGGTSDDKDKVVSCSLSNHEKASSPENEKTAEQPS